MARFILRPKNQQQEEKQKPRLETQQRQQSRRQCRLETDPAKIALILRQPRSKEYMEMMAKLDAGGVHLDPALVEKMAAIIKKEFPRVDIPKILIGVVGHCYLGEPYEVHTLDITGQVVIHHYKLGEPLPAGLEKARHLAQSTLYEFIEVYWDACRAINSDGSVAVIHL